jgi:DNA-binding MarR family transcriptional regulator
MSAGHDTSAHDVAQLIEQVGRCVHGDGYAGGLNPAQWAALRFFDRANRFSRTVGAFAAYHGSTRGTASQTVKSLVGKGCLRREPVPGDRRSVRLALTEQGRRMLERDPMRALVEAARALDGERRGALVDGLDRVLEQVLLLQGRARFGVCACCCHLEADSCAATTGSPYRCGLLQESLGEDDVARICVSHRAGASPRGA